MARRGILETLFGWLRPKPPTPPAPTPAPDGSLVAAHNRERAKVSAPELRSVPALDAAAQKHADWMASNRRLSHTGSRGSSFVDRIQAEGYRMQTGGENIAAGHRDVAEVMQGWMDSRGHRANILNASFREIGVGRSGDYWCVVFATPLGLREVAAGEVEEQPDGLVKPDFSFAEGI